MTFVKLAAPALAWLAFWSAAPAEARVSAPVTGATAKPILIDDKDDGRSNDERRGSAEDGEDGEGDEDDDLDMMDMGDDGDDDDGDRSAEDDDDDRRDRDDDRRN